jgi:cell division protease FtsH
MNDKLKNMVLWAIIMMIMLSVFSNFNPHPLHSERLTYSAFIRAVNQGEVAEVTIADKKITGRKSNGQFFSTYMPVYDQLLLSELIDKNVNVIGQPPQQRSLLLQIFINWFPMLLLIALWVYFLRQQTGMGGSKGGPFSFGRSRAKMLVGDQIKTTFKDVAGIDESREEIQELVDFLRDPFKFQQVGGKIPCGALLVGPPGTGKTLLARAVAGEANVPFFSISGSDFVEMFVGVGASRVRDMFQEAKKRAPCIIFIDEIDAVGRHRGAGVGGGHDEREQTLNQLLVEMDGFEGKEGVIVMAATNRPDVLDPALLRPGRFDRQIDVPLPDINGREAILTVHLKKIVADKQVDPRIIARGTPGFSGADLANLVNEAALYAARMNKRLVHMADMEQAKDKILMGTERQSMAMSAEEKKLTAYHEAGHALVGLNMPDHDPVYKVSIIPRGRALGVTMYLPEKDRYSHSYQRLESQLASLYGGRLAEELIFGAAQVTTGASNDIEKATKIAKNMVMRWGLSKDLGPISFACPESEVFLGRGNQNSIEVSEETSRLIDAEVKAIIDRNYKRAADVLKKQTKNLHLIAKALIKYETITEAEIKALLKGQAIDSLRSSDDHSSTGTPRTRKKDSAGKESKAHGKKEVVSMGESDLDVEST